MSDLKVAGKTSAKVKMSDQEVAANKGPEAEVLDTGAAAKTGPYVEVLGKRAVAKTWADFLAPYTGPAAKRRVEVELAHACAAVAAQAAATREKLRDRCNRTMRTVRRRLLRLNFISFS